MFVGLAAITGTQRQQTTPRHTEVDNDLRRCISAAYLSIQLEEQVTAIDKVQDQIQFAASLQTPEPG